MGQLIEAHEFFTVACRESVFPWNCTVILLHFELKHTKNATLILDDLKTHCEFDQKIVDAWNRFSVIIYDVNKLFSHCGVQKQRPNCYLHHCISNTHTSKSCFENITGVVRFGCVWVEEKRYGHDCWVKLSHDIDRSSVIAVTGHNTVWLTCRGIPVLTGHYCQICDFQGFLTLAYARIDPVHAVLLLRVSLLKQKLDPWKFFIPLRFFSPTLQTPSRWRVLMIFRNSWDGTNIWRGGDPQNRKLQKKLFCVFDTIKFCCSISSTQMTLQAGFFGLLSTSKLTITCYFTSKYAFGHALWNSWETLIFDFLEQNQNQGPTITYQASK